MPLRNAKNDRHFINFRDGIRKLLNRFRLNTITENEILLYLDRARLDSNSIEVAGWALAKRGIASVEIYINAQRIGEAEYGLPRPDVGQVYPRVNNSTHSGFNFQADVAKFLDADAEKITVVIKASTHAVDIWKRIVLQKVSRLLNKLLFNAGTENEILLYLDKARLVSANIEVAGWALAKEGIASVEVYINAQRIGEAEYGFPRPDVGQGYPRVNNSNHSGFNFQADVAKFLDADAEKLTVVIKASTPSGSSTEIWKRIVVQKVSKLLNKLQLNAITDDEILLYLDRVRLVSASIEVAGWALAKEGIASVEVYINAQRIGEAEYGFPRPDVGQGYPRVNNSNHSGFHFRADVAKFLDADAEKITVVIKASTPSGSSTEILKRIVVQKISKLLEQHEAIAPYEAYLRNNQLHPPLLNLLSEAGARFAYRPLISILMPVYNVEPRWLKAAITSVLDQVYPFWELCLADDASTKPETLAVLRNYQHEDRINVVFRTENGNICAASNSAAKLARGEFVSFMDNDDVLAPNALFEMVRLLQEYPDTDLIYSDEDKIDVYDRRYDPQFKPEWSPELFLSYNYVNHFVCLRRELFDAVGRFRPGYEGAQDYDLLLRVSEQTERIRHIPKILYHWRAVQGSSALQAADKPAMRLSALKGLRDHLQRQQVGAIPYQPKFANGLGLPISKLDWPDEGPSVGILIPTYNQYPFLKKCIESIIRRTTYKNYQIVVIDNESNEKKTLTYLEELKAQGISIERISNKGGPFSFSRINNLAVQRVMTDYLLFLNNDTEVIEPKWLSRLAGYLSLPGVGATGARLLYPDNTIQHAGVVLNMYDGIIPDHAFLHHPKDAISYYFLAEVARNCSAVTGACLLTRRADFVRLGGFNEHDLKVSLQDVDYCLRLAQEKLRTVYVAGAELMHYQAISRHKEDDPRELAHLRKTSCVSHDPYYNPNLSKIAAFVPDTRCSLVDYQEYLTQPLKALIFTHDLELKGAPKAMYDLAVGLRAASPEKIITTVFSPVPGPFQSFYTQAGIACHVVEQNIQNVGAGWMTKADYEMTVKKVQAFLEREQPDVVITNTVFSFYIIRAAQHQQIPVIWIISESFTPPELERTINDFALPDCVRAFAQAYRVVFGSDATRTCYELLNSQQNFQVIHNSVDRTAIDQFLQKVSRKKARQHLGIPDGKKVLLTVGTICERKDQKTHVAAAARLKKIRSDFCCYLVGASLRADDVYLQDIYNEIDSYHLSNIITIVPETEKLFEYYRASDIFVFTSHSECYPLAVLEAMAFGLPIVTTPCYGVKEQVRNVNALFFNESDVNSLATLINRLLTDEDERNYLGKNSRAIFDYQQTYEEMIEKYLGLVFGSYISTGRNRRGETFPIPDPSIILLGALDRAAG